MLAEWALKYHTLGKPGKVGVVATKRVGSASDLSVAYSPGVAQPCLAIADDPSELGDASIAERSSTHMCTSSCAHLPCLEGFSRVCTACMA